MLGWKSCLNFPVYFISKSKIQYLREAANDTFEELKPASLPYIKYLNR